MSGFARAFALGVLTAAAIGLPAAAQIMVTSSQGPSAKIYRAGTLLKATQPIQLRAGDHVTLMDGGETREFRGPGSYLPRGPAAPEKGLFDWFLNHNPPPTTGGVRGGPALSNARPASIWQVDVAAPGDFCVASSQPVELWRRDTDAATVVITRMGDASKRTLKWPAGDASLGWPADLPLADGEAYLVWSTDGLDAGVLWRAVDPPSGDWTGFAGQLLKKGCFAQYAILYGQYAPPGVAAGAANGP